MRADGISISENLRSTYELHIGDLSEKITLPSPGEQFIENSLAAAAAAYALGADLAQIKFGLESFSPQEHRMTPVKLENGALVLDDSYNNNPSAAKKAIETLNRVAGKRKTVVVIGDMLELGKEENKRHKELGEFLAQSGINYLIGVGPLSHYLTEEASKTMGNKHVWWVENAEKVLPLLKPLLKKQTITLVKASRSIGLDRVMTELS